MRKISERIIDLNSEPFLWLKLLERSYIPDRYASASIDQVDPTVREWVSQRLRDPQAWLGQGHGFYLHGPLNSGKSSVAGLLGVEALKRGLKVLWIPVRDVPSVRFKDTPQAEAMFKLLGQVDLLILDDLGAETYRQEGPAGGALESVVRSVYDRKRSLIVTSNISWGHSNLFARYGEDSGLISTFRRILTPITVSETRTYGEGSQEFRLVVGG